MKIVLDATAAFIMLAAPKRVEGVIYEAHEILAPELVVTELLNARWKMTRTRATAPALEHIISLLERIHLEPTLPYAADAAALAHSIDHPVYDCVYAVLAMREHARLLTADRRFAGKLDPQAVEIAVI